MRRRRRDESMVEMQMGPMIDMVFLLLVFFIATAKPKKEESDVSLKLPGSVAQEEAVNLPDEVRVMVYANGTFSLNQQALSIRAMKKTLYRLKESSDSAQTEALVTVDAEDAATHQHIVRVFNACAEAGIKGVTFAGSSTEARL